MNKHDFEREIVVYLFQTSNAMQKNIDRTLKEHHITTKQFFMMIFIGSFGYDPKLGELAERFGTSHQNTKQVLLKLEKIGYVELYKDEKDTRITRVRHTKNAHSFWQGRDNKDVKQMNTIFDSLTYDEAMQLATLLKKVHVQLDILNKEANDL